MNTINNRQDVVRELGFSNPYHKINALEQRLLEETGLEQHRASLNFTPSGLRIGLSQNGTFRSSTLDFPFNADELWKTVDDLAEAVQSKEYGVDYDDLWLEDDSEW